MIIGSSTNPIGSMYKSSCQTEQASLGQGHSDSALTSIQTDAYSVCISKHAMELMNRRGVTGEEIQTFKNIIEKAQEAGAYHNPKAFLNSLSGDEMEVVRKVHCLANRIKVEGLDYEGAYNLLMQPGAYKDLNNDGLLGVGLGKSRVFPPPNAPDAVKKAWEEATAGMTEIEKLIQGYAPFMAAEASANIKHDSQGNPIGFYRPGENGYTNIYTEPGFTYQGLVDKCLANLEIGKGHMKFESYVAAKEFLENFGKALDKHGVA